MYEYVVAILCSIVFILSLIGNLLVISVIIRYKRLKNATNYILLSLAIADLTVAFCVMIPATIQDILGVWIWSEFFCKCYTALDITCCTASILHLLLVSIDRYIAIFNPMTYKTMVKKWHIFALIFVVWSLSACLSFIPVFMGWNKLRDSSLDENIIDHENNFTNLTLIKESNDSLGLFLNSSITENDKKVCYMESNIPYAIISSSLSFWIPLIIMTVVYLQIYIVAKRQAKQIAELTFNSQNSADQHSTEQYLKHYQTTNKKDQKAEILIDEFLQNDDNNNNNDKIDKKMRFVGLDKSLKKIQKKRTKDKKAIKTLGIIMGIFTFCWLPFFLMYLLVPLTNSYIPIFWDRVITWIGYLNSFINPIVYALNNRDFRKAYIATLKSVFENATCYRASLQDDLNMRNTSKKNKRKHENVCLNKLFCCKKNNETIKTVPNRDFNNVISSSLTENKNHLPLANLQSLQNHNHIENEIVKLIDKQPDSIQYIDEISDNHSFKKSELEDVNNQNLEFYLINDSKFQKKKSYLDFTDDDISLGNKKIRNHKMPNSFSSDIIHKRSMKNKGLNSF